MVVMAFLPMIRGCERYEPFAESLLFYQDRALTVRDFFDFSWTNMHKKSMNIWEDYSTQTGLQTANLATWSNWNAFFTAVLKHLQNSLNFTGYHSNDHFYPTSPSSFLSAKDGIDVALKNDVGLNLFATGIILEGSDYSKLDISVSIDTSALCIATPHSGYMSQGLVIFKSFSPVAWIFISVTITTLVMMQFIFQYSQYKLFHRLYTDAEADYFRETSSLLTVYAYFICGSPPSLHLGHLFTGKILFLIFSFATIIISTVFLSGMTTLLSDRVLYPEIDSVKSLEESDMLIQIFEEMNTETNFFDHLNQSEALRVKLADNLQYYRREMYGEIFMSIVDNWNKSDPSHDPLPAFLLNHKHFEMEIKEAEKNVRSIAETDAVLVSVPFSSRPPKNIRISPIVFLDHQWSEYHLMSECLMTYPLVFAFSKDSFFFDKVNHMMAQYFETGLARKILKADSASEDELELDVPYAENDSEPRAFNLNDLQSGFIGLIFGLFISFLAFVGELFFDYFQHLVTIKFLMRLKNVLFKRGRNTG
ncbi:unnamed protein product [Bemisia tabaci]|uniref:Ionotropic receptor n=1 Tax=Bemisia tabaci TaxID=7038 RepID=A0A9P0F758_BEMTA|nr:unnamed protein product [Bemisia tabaci]